MADLQGLDSKARRMDNELQYAIGRINDLEKKIQELESKNNQLHIIIEDLVNENDLESSHH